MAQRVVPTSTHTPVGALTAAGVRGISTSQSPCAPVYRVALTGGPCGGKSTAFEAIAERLGGFGFRVFQVPEAATLLIGGGWDFATLPGDSHVEAQTQLLSVQMAMEDAFHSIAKEYGDPAVIICDRGIMDNRAFVAKEQWDAIERNVGRSLETLRDERYDMVVHMVTAAIGAEEFYTLANNAARTETPAQAAAIDHALREAWLGAPVVSIVGNETAFEEKIQRVLSAICAHVGVPRPASRRRYFKVEQRNDDGVPMDGVEYRDFDVLHTYLRAPHHNPYDLLRVHRRVALRFGKEADAYTRFLHENLAPLSDSHGMVPVREAAKVLLAGIHLDREADVACGDADDDVRSADVLEALTTSDDTVQWRALSMALQHTNRVSHSFRSRAKDSAPDASEVATCSRSLSSREYRLLAEQARPTWRAVRKRRRVFQANGLSCEWDTVISPTRYDGMTVVAVEDVDGGADAADRLPDFLGAAVEVTGDSSTQSSYLAAAAGKAAAAEAAEEAVSGH